MTTDTAPRGNPTTVLNLALAALRDVIGTPAALSDSGVKQIAEVLLQASEDPHPAIETLLQLVELLEQEEAVATAILGDPDQEKRALEKLLGKKLGPKLTDHEFFVIEKPLDEDAIKRIFGKLSPGHGNHFKLDRGRS